MDLHMSHRGGKYSVERLLALDEFTRNTSLMHVMAVCVVAPLPSSLFVIFQEAVPLQNPVDGWQANYGFWIRAWVIAGTVTYVISVQAKYLTQGFSISSAQLLLLVMLTSCVLVAVTMVVAAYAWFPIPFFIITMVPVFYATLVASFVGILGIPAVREMLKRLDYFVRFVAFIGAQQLMVVIYPAYQALFQAKRHSNSEVVVILLLPVMKLIVKNIALRCLAHMEDTMPEGVIFTVDFFNALYTSTSMESASSMPTVAIIALIDLVQMFTVLYRVHRQTHTILARLQAATGKLGDGNGDDLLSAARCFAHLTQNAGPPQRALPGEHEVVGSRSSKTMRDRCIQVVPRENFRREAAPADDDGDDVFHKLGTAPEAPSRRNESFLRLYAGRKSTMQATGTLLPTAGVHQIAIASVPPSIFSEAREVLFTTECLVLSACLDAIVPLFYGSFLLVMVHLPSAEYHTELVGITSDNIGETVKPVFAFAGVQCVLFGLLSALLYRNLGMNSLYHLAFVLETQVELIQSKLLTWVLMTMAFRVVHFGTCCCVCYYRSSNVMLTLQPLTFSCASSPGIDFTFHFAWLKTPNN